ncbi:alpha/beta family hydrolase [Microlunatus sp. Gsoil 973]|jgi:predicted alpha/beta-hydrolase family hydrolase|uniref:alpha/beta hydrolase family protein n=1 Tax=Microlunatus sp. Gsoil 973 TaxID=2672569 RepID=UPI0012B500AB|nr:alpha/beta family hydrolase [Microlunatus sp. Gsoil 973]QGN32265.1 hydrolase [Microlunatus sp. Gsoil 973]
MPPRTRNRHLDIETPEGPGRFWIADADTPAALLIMGHGAGGGVDAVDLSVLASRLPDHGVTVARFEQPWRLAGKKVASPPPRLDTAWNAAVPSLLTELPGLPYYFGGRSAGARVACRTAPGFPDVRGVVCCAFPLHPPGRPDRSRAAELLGAALPRLVVQGERDSFGTAEELGDLVAPGDTVSIVAVPGADHSMKTAKSAPISPAQVRDLITDAVLGFVAE